MNTNIFQEHKKTKILPIKKRNRKDYLINYCNKKYQNKSLFQRTILVCLMSLLFLSQFQLSFGESYALITLKKHTSEKGNNVVYLTNDITAMYVNGESVTVSKSVKTSTERDVEVKIVFKSPLTKCNTLFKALGAKVIKIDLTELDTSQCSSFLQFLQNTKTVNYIKIGGGGQFSTAAATTMESMFDTFGADGCQHEIDFSSFNTEKVTKMNKMFNGACFQFLDLRGFNTAKVTTMASMFTGSKALSLDLSTFDTSSVSTFNGMFSSMTNLISLSLSSFNIKTNAVVTQMFFQMTGTPKLCDDFPSKAVIKAQLEEAKKTSVCNDPCFDSTRDGNKFFGYDCYESCQDTTDSHYEYNNQCYESCPKLTDISEDDPFLCVDILDCTESYYNLDKTECLSAVPEGYYCDDDEKRTIAPCPTECKTCDLNSVTLNVCSSCNNDNSYYEAEGYTKNEPYVACFTSTPFGYYYDQDELKYKRCYEKCITCLGAGDSTNNNCETCIDGLIDDGLPNCYDKCPSPQYYYFDDSNTFYCADSCPDGYNIIEQKSKCSKDCRKDPPYINEHLGECLEQCPIGYHAPNDDKKCVLALQCDHYYNYEYDDCLDEVPEGFFCNSTEAKTIDKCKQKCKTCSYDSVITNNDLCNLCNNEEGFYYKEDDSVNTADNKECYKDITENYFLENDVYKRCYKSCQTCSSLGNNREHLCDTCPSGYTKNETSNCYKICDFHYYFDSNYEYYCTDTEDCPQEKSKLIIDKNECVEACVGDYRFEFLNKCYTACPIGSYYNFEQTNCIGSIPEGYYLNDTQTIDKCDQKCKECILDSVSDDACVSCNNDLSFYKKEDDIRSNTFYNCFTGEQDGYRLDLTDKEYKKCHKTCKSCEELGDVRDNKCTGCYSNATLNGTNCFLICKFYHYFEDSGEYFCTQDASCPSKRSKLIFDTNECVEDCTGQYKFEFDGKCYTGCPPGTYYNFTQTGCIATIPSGYYMNDSVKRTIDKCESKCEKECILDFEKNNVICEKCNNADGFYKKEDDYVKDGYYDCYTGDIQKYFLDIDNNEYKKCYVTCLTCDELGDAVEHKCTGCSSQYTKNGSMCLLNCDYYHYFDNNKIYQCSVGPECPPDFPNLIVGEKSCVLDCPDKLIVDKKECTDKCTGQYKFEFDDKCYTGCPPGTYYNFTQTGCIATIPVGYYMNDSVKRTIDKCDIKCENECILDETSKKVLCKACNNPSNYFKKEIDYVKDGYYDCYKGDLQTYYLDIDNKQYKKCFEKCLFCTEYGNILNHKCKQCPNNKYTLNGTNCYEICDYFFYFDLDKVYHCTENQDCPPVAPNKIVEKKTCVPKCEDEEKYNMVYENRCYDKCPLYYNYEQTKCIGEIPPGFYLNNSEARTIDKCIEKCETCDTTGVNNDQCLTCNNLKEFYLKEEDKDKTGNINCYNSSVEGYYLEKDEKMYKKCFEKCKNCNGKGIITEHNCNECNPDFTLNGTNCYEICDYYYYFDEEGIYHCTEKDECPFKYKNIIPEKRQCIDDCKNDDVYIYVHKHICLSEPYIPNCNSSSTFILKEGEERGQCTEDCTPDQFIEGECGLRNNIPLDQDQVITMLKDSIENGTLNGYLTQMIEEEGTDYLIWEDTITYHLTTLKNSKILTNKNTSTVDLGDCENKLRDKYDIDAELPLIILKIDYYLNYSLIPVIGYEVFDPRTFKKLDLSICENNVLSLTVPTEQLNESTLYIYDPLDSYYTDECSPSKLEDKYDIILSDRQISFIKNNLSICENNCVLKEYITENKTSICECSIKNLMLSSSEVHNKDDLFLQEFSSSGSSSVNSLKCTSTLFSKNGIINNISFYVYLLLLISLIFCCVQFYRKGYDNLNGYINQILTSKEKKTEEEIPKIENYDDYSDKINQKTLDKILKLRTPKNFRTDFKGVIAKDDINYQDNYSNNQKSINKLEIYNFRGGNDFDSNNYHLETEKEIIYTDFELNSFTYKQAIGVDLRTFKQIYKSFVKYNHPLFFIFSKTKDYNSIYIKVSLIFISLSLYYFVNSLFITKSTVHDIYEKENSNDIVKYIPYIIVSFIICYALDKIIKYVSLSGNSILSIKQESLYNNAKIRATQVRKILPIKYICFYILGFVSVLIFGYYIATFSSVYQNTQFVLIKNFLISYAISLVFPFIIILLPSVFRRFALKDATRQWMFDLSRVLQYI